MERGTCAEGRPPVKKEAEVRMRLLLARNTWGDLKKEEVREGALLESSEGARPCPTP